MTSAKFNQLFDAYRQQTIETSVALLDADPNSNTQTWLQLLQRHVQEWKQHYGQENQAIERVKQNHQHIYHQANLLNSSEQKAGLIEDRESQEIRASFQVKRDLIWARQQQELTTGKISA